MSVRSCQFICFNSFISIHSCQVIHVNSFIRSFVLSFVRSFPHSFIHSFFHFISFHFFQLCISVHVRTLAVIWALRQICCEVVNLQRFIAWSSAYSSWFCRCSCCSVSLATAARRSVFPSHYRLQWPKWWAAACAGVTCSTQAVKTTIQCFSATLSHSTYSLVLSLMGSSTLAYPWSPWRLCKPDCNVMSVLRHCPSLSKTSCFISLFGQYAFAGKWEPSWWRCGREVRVGVPCGLGKHGFACWSWYDPPIYCRGTYAAIYVLPL